MMKPLSSMTQVFSILIYKKKQRDFKLKEKILMESTSLSTTSYSASPSSLKGFKTNFSPREG